MNDMQLSEGDVCLLAIGKTRFFCRVISAGEDLVTIRFNIVNALVEGMLADLERYDEEGASHFPIRVEHAPAFPNDPAKLRRLPGSHRHTNRGGWRIPSEFAMRLKRAEDTHPSAVVVNDISAGGAQIETPMALTPGSEVELAILIPGTVSERLISAEVMYVVPEPIDEFGGRLAGLRFHPDSGIEAALTEYIWRRIRELHPEDFDGK